MENSRRRGLSDAEATKMLDKILEEDKETLNEETSKSCTACGEEDYTIRRVCDCMRFAENSSRFSLRVMEAMRSLQDEEDAFLPSCTVEDIVGYIVANYRDDGDLCAQVRTALKQVCSQGFVMELLEDEYHLVGPDAVSMNKVTCSNKRADCLLSSTPKPAPKRRKKDDEDCVCEESSDDEILEQTCRRSPRRRACPRRTRILDVETGGDVSEEEEESATLDTDVEDMELDNGKESSSRTENGRDTSRTYLLDKEKHTGLAQHPPMNIVRRRSAKIQERSVQRENNGTRAHLTTTRGETSSRRDEDDSVIEGTLSDDLNDVHQEPHSIQTNKDNERNEELKRWIKRCQAECVRQGRQRRNN